MEKEPIVPNIKPSAEDIAQRKRQMQVRRQAAQRAAAAKAPSGQTAAPKQTLSVIALVMALIMGVATAFLFLQLQALQKQLNESGEVIRSQGKNLEQLNDQLSATGENANLSVDALKMLVRDNSREVRKLWDLSNKRNRPGIADNSKSIKSLSKSVAAVNKAQSSQKTQLQKLTSLTDKMKALTTRISKLEVMKADVSAARLGISQNTESIQSLEGSVNKLKQGGDLGDMRLEMEDIRIRLDRIQNAMAGSQGASR